MYFGQNWIISGSGQDTSTCHISDQSFHVFSLGGQSWANTDQNRIISRGDKHTSAECPEVKNFTHLFFSFWPPEGYISMLHFRPILPCVLNAQKPHRTDGCWPMLCPHLMSSAGIITSMPTCCHIPLVANACSSLLSVVFSRDIMYVKNIYPHASQIYIGSLRDIMNEICVIEKL